MRVLSLLYTSNNCKGGEETRGHAVYRQPSRPGSVTAAVVHVYFFISLLFLTLTYLGMLEDVTDRLGALWKDKFQLEGRMRSRQSR